MNEPTLAARLIAASHKARLEADEQFAQFVFEHFGGYWLRGTARERGMRALPERIAARVTELAREYELRRGGP